MQPIITTTVEYTVQFTPRDLPGVLDMMRYEQANVVAWDHLEPDQRLGHDRWQVTLRADQDRFQPDRWSSFMLRANLTAQY